MMKRPCADREQIANHLITAPALLVPATMIGRMLEQGEAARLLRRLERGIIPKRRVWR
jgi:hypothetical protein